MTNDSSVSLLKRLLIAVLVLWSLGALLIILALPTWSDRGQFGDLFGAINALFSGLVFASLLYTIHLQREEIALQREELRLQREEMKASREQLEHQAQSQRALFLATVGQIKVASIQASMESIKMESERLTPSFRDSHVNQLRKASSEIQAIAAEIEVVANVG